MESQVTAGANASGSDYGGIKLVYILYLAGLIFGITALIGLVMAYVNRSDADPVAQSHYGFQIRTFWIGLLMLVLGGVTTVALVGYGVLLFWLIWTIVRVAKGMKYIGQKKAHPDPTTWLFG